jgi:hypothetical protein
MGVLIPSLFASIGTIVSGIFGLKQQQASLVQTAIGALNTTVGVASAEQASRAAIIQTEAMSQSWLPRNIRPVMLLIFTALIVSFWFGYVPPHFNDPMSPMMEEMFGLVKIGFGGYIGGRSLEKVVDIIFHWRALQTAIERKLL